MAENETKKGSYQPPAPEELKSKSEESSSAPPEKTGSSDKSPVSKKLDLANKKILKRRGTYRPSHKATFIGLAIAGAILAINAGAIAFVLNRSPGGKSQLNAGQVTISGSALSKLGVNTSSVGDSGIQLTVGPDTKFSGDVQVAGNTTIAGKLTLNSSFVASSASFNKLQAGDTTLSQLNVDGKATANSLNLRRDLGVAGAAQIQDQLTVNKNVTVGGSLSVAGNVLIGGSLQVGSFRAGSLVISGHVMTTGGTPGVSVGPAAGSHGSASISGNDEAGTVAVNAGAGAGSGEAASISFNSSYSSIPHVVVTPVGSDALVYISRNAGGFTIYISSVAPLHGGRGYAFDYIVEQ